MKTIVALALCFLLGISIHDQGWTALLWVPVGFVFGLYSTAQMILPLILGLPIAIRLVSKGRMRPGVFGAIIVTPVIWFVLLAVLGFAIGWFWPAVAESLYNNRALNLSANLGIVAIILSPFSKASRADFRKDFDSSYRRFAKEPAQTEAGNG